MGLGLRIVRQETKKAAIIMNLKGHVLYSAEQTDKLCKILTDDEIRRIVEREITRMVGPLKSMVLTWEKSRTEYRLEIILTEEKTGGFAVPEERCVTIGCIGAHEYNALSELLTAGRRLYFRLKKDFPVLQRRLSTYKFLHT